MAVGFPPFKKISFSIPPEKAPFFMAFALETVREFGWSLLFVRPHKLVASTPLPLNRWNEEVMIIQEGEQIRLISKSEGDTVFDKDRNQQNLELLRSALDKKMENAHHAEARDQLEEINFFLSSNHYSAFEPTEIRPLKERILHSVETLKDKKFLTVTPLLVSLNLLVFLLMIFNGVDSISPSVDALVSWGGNLKMKTLDGQWWRLLTACFLHGGFLHLFLNLYGLSFIGSILEREIGKSRLLVGYLLMGLGGSMASLWWHDNIVSVGASGAIFGLFGMFLSLYATERIRYKANEALYANTLFFVAINLVIGAVFDMFDNAGHIGGLVTGIVIGLLYYPSLSEEVSPRKIRLNNLSVIIVGSFVFGALYLLAPNWPLMYQKNMDIYTQNEEEALAYFQLSDYTSTQERLEFLEQKSIPLWEENIALMDELLDHHALPSDIQPRISHLKTYGKLRLRSYELIRSNMKDPEQDFSKELAEVESAIRDELIELSPDNVENYISRAKNRNANGNFKGAISDYSTALLLRPNDLDIYLQRARVYRETGDYLKAINDYKEITEVLAADYDLLMEIGATFELAEEYPSAISHFSKAINLSPEASPAYNARGWSYLKMELLEKAEADFLKAVELNPAYASAFNNLAILEEERKNLAKARKYLERAIEADPNADFAWRNLGRLKYNEKEYEKALPFYNQAINVQPQNASNYYVRATTFLQLKEYENMLADMEKAVALSPRQSFLYEMRAIAYDQLEQKRKAVEDFSTAISLDSTSYFYRSYRAGVYLDLEMYDSASRDFQETIRLAPDFSSGYGNYGWLHYLRSNYDSCIYYSEKAIALDSTAFYAKYNKALAHLCKGEFELSKILYQNYVAEQQGWQQQVNQGAIEDLENLIKKDTLKAEAGYILKEIFKVKPPST